MQGASMTEAATTSDDIDLEQEARLLEVEGAIAALHGIEAVRLVPGERRPVDELHVVVTSEREPKQTVRDVQSLLQASYGIDIDRRVISVVQLADDTGARLRDGMPRPILDTVQMEVRGGETSVTVGLTSDDRDVIGAAGPVADSGIARAAAVATLEAVNDLLDGLSLDLVGADVVSIGAQRVAVAAVVASDGRSREALTGSAAIRTHEADAIARAVLDATNRLHRD